jgi:enamine deaminase RidA (YjgF/YER057c/UK114 family)
VLLLYISDQEIGKNLRPKETEQTFNDLYQKGGFTMEINRPPALWGSNPLPYAKGMAVTGAKGFVFLTGCVGEDTSTDTFPPGLGAQTTLALEDIKQKLEEFGTSLKYICHMMWHVAGEFPKGLLNDPRNQERRMAEQEFWKKYCPEFVMGKNPPASTLVIVPALVMPEMLVEITVIAAIP